MSQNHSSERASVPSAAPDQPTSLYIHHISLERLTLLLQLIGTLTIIAFVPTNMAKTLCLIILWGITFRWLELKELIMFFGACVFFTVMNLLSLAQGIFSFTAPDLLGMPVFEFFMWGFYLLHTKRMLGDVAPSFSNAAWMLALVYSIAFATVKDTHLLLLVTAILLALGVILFHSHRDLTYLIYMVLIGAAVEYTGVWSGQWAYPDAPPGGVPLWFITLWGGVGLLFYRLILPLMARFSYPEVAKSG